MSYKIISNSPSVHNILFNNVLMSTKSFLVVGSHDRAEQIVAALEAVEGQKPSTNSAMDAMQLFAQVDIDRDMDYEVARIARNAIRQYRAARHQ